MSRSFFAQLARGAQLGRRFDDAGNDHGQSQFCQPRRGFRQQAVQAELLRRAEDGGDMAVRQRAFDAQIVDGQRHGFVLQHAAQGLDLRIRPIGDIGDGARPDLAAIAIAFAQEDGGRRGAVWDAGDVHARTFSDSRYMSTPLMTFTCLHKTARNSIYPTQSTHYRKIKPEVRFRGKRTLVCR